MIEDMLVELGAETLGPVMRLEPALRIAQESALDFAILDVNLDGITSFPVAEVLALRGVPFAFATGYGLSGVDKRFSGYPVIKKPFDIAILRNVLPVSPSDGS
jgi:hypothetical protein